ncbi:MAG TPA: hypothetical protein VFT91_07345 [Dehalococcoidia bacterium]|nr:hypothetical protein [Dehalococcoidia bacterium]
MSCYLRRLDDILLAAGIRLTRENRQRVHEIIQEITGQEGCPQAWKAVKIRLLHEDTWEQFVTELRERWREPVTS